MTLLQPLLLPVQVLAGPGRGLLRRRLLPFCTVLGTLGPLVRLAPVQTAAVLELASARVRSSAFARSNILTRWLQDSCRDASCSFRPCGRGRRMPGRTCWCRGCICTVIAVRGRASSCHDCQAPGKVAATSASVYSSRSPLLRRLPAVDTLLPQLAVGVEVVLPLVAAAAQLAGKPLALR